MVSGAVIALVCAVLAFGLWRLLRRLIGTRAPTPVLVTLRRLWFRRLRLNRRLCLSLLLLLRWQRNLLLSPRNLWLRPRPNPRQNRRWLFRIPRLSSPKGLGSWS